MIRIYDKEERVFNHLGLGSLDEATSAAVVEELNGAFELEMEYPITGKHFDKLQFRNIIFCKSSAHGTEQPFRIYNITKPIDGIVTVSAEHISYDASGVTILPIRNEDSEIESFGVSEVVNDKTGYYLDSILNDVNKGINNSAAIKAKNYFSVSRHVGKENVFIEEGYVIEKPMSLRSMLGGSSVSLLDIFKGEYMFDRFNIILMDKRGSDRGISIRYGKNMTDIEQEASGTNLFTAIFPFYSKAYTESYTSTTPVFQSAYIVNGITPLRSDWLSTELADNITGFGGIALTPIIELMRIGEELVEKLVAIKVKTPGSYLDKIYRYVKNTVANGNISDVYIVEGETEFESSWLSFSDGGSPITSPLFGIIYIVKTEGSQYYNRKFIFDNGSYVEYGGDGFYSEALDGSTLDPEMKTALGLFPPPYPISWNGTEWVEDLEGDIYVLPYKPNVGTVTVDKYVYLDLITLLPVGSQWFDEDTDTLYTSVTPNTWVGATEEIVITGAPFGIPIPVGSHWFDEDTDTLYTSIVEDTWVGSIEIILPVVQPEVFTPELPTIMENGLLYVNQELKDLDVQNIFSLDLTSELDDIGGLKPTDMTQEMLFNKAEQYLKDNDFTKVKESLKISFIKLSESPEYAQFKDLEIVELGDEISVIYEELGVNSKHRVISTEYNVLTDSYNEIELGDKTEKITNNVMSYGDNISNLKNDANFANKMYLTQLIAENAQLVNAEIQNAIIKTLEVANINVTGLLQASRATIDSLVAQLFTTDYAEVAKALIAGSVRVKGDITLDSGSITINKVLSPDYVGIYILDNNTPLEKDWFTDNSAATKIWTYITHSSTELIGDINLDAHQDVTGVAEALAFLESYYPANNQTIGTSAIVLDTTYEYIQFECQTGSYVPIDPESYPEGTIFKVLTDGYYKDKKYQWNPILQVYKLVSTYVFSVDREGNVIANSLIITGGSINIGDNFYVSNEGILTAKGVKVIDGEISINDKFMVDSGGLVNAKSITIEEAYAEKIDSDEITVNEVITDRVYFLNDKIVYMERVTEDDTTYDSHTITASATAMGFQDGNVLYFAVQVTTNYDLFYDKNFNVTVTYRDNYGATYTTDINVTVYAGTHSRSGNGFVSVSAMKQYSIDTSAVCFPHRYTESITTGGVTDKIVININGTQYDLISGIVANAIAFFAQIGEPAGTDFPNNSLLFDIDE